MGPVIRASGLCKSYPQRGGLRAALALLARGRLRDDGARPALEDVSFELERGGALGVVGRNGSGKTTLLRLLSGGLQASRGRVDVRGRRASLIDLAAGLDPSFTGRDNAFLLNVLAGASRNEARRSLDEIRAFSGLGEAFEEPVRSYSSGMTLRLAFSAAISSEPDVLLVDEVLAVGDHVFQQRCMLRIRHLQQRGCSVVLVSHDETAILRFCDRALWLEHGRVVCAGDPGRVVREYMGAQYDEADGHPPGTRPVDGAAPRAAADSAPGTVDAGSRGSPHDGRSTPDLLPACGLANIDHRYGDGRARIIGMALRDADGLELGSPSPGQELRVVVSARADAPIASPVIGFTLRNRLGEILSATNSADQGHRLGPLRPGELLSVEFGLRWPAFASGSFSLSPAIADGDLQRHEMNDWVDNAIVFEVANPRARYGWLQLEEVAVRCIRHDEPER